MKVSFCTTCYNRLKYLRKVFARNMDAINRETSVEWVILNYNNAPDLEQFMHSELRGAGETVRYVRTLRERKWHASVAKNLAHHAATGDVLMNLDCDNFIGDALPIVRRYFSAGARVLHMWSGVNRDGTCGRIAIDRELFSELGGYDEEFQPMGYQDLDLLDRARHLGNLVFLRACDTRLAIKNTKADSVANCGQPGVAWGDYDKANRALSARNLRSGRLRANGERRIDVANEFVITTGF